MIDPIDNFGIVHDGDKNYFLTEEPTEIEHGVYEAEAIDEHGTKFNVELEGWGDGDFDLDEPLDIW